MKYLFYGLNNSMARTLSWSNGMNPLVMFDQIGHIQFLKFDKAFRKRNLKFGFILKEFEILNYKRLFKIRCRRGIRLLRGLPVRGQRTHTNAWSAFAVGKIRKRTVFAGKEKLKGTRAERKVRYYALQERKKALRLRASRQKVRALLKVVKRKRKAKERERAWIMSKQKAQMLRARKKWQIVAAKKKQQRFRKW